MASERLLLAAAMIVRDEADHLAACLASIAGVVDEIVVVDTGSSDESPAIAESFGARVIHRPWDGDFSAARNAALDAVRAEWILYVDADERLRPVAREDVVALLESAPEIAFRLKLRPFIGASPAREYRLWRNDPRIRFEGIIHEKVTPAIKDVADTDARRIGFCDLELDHFGYEGDQSRKHARNLPLLRAQLEVEPRNVFNWRHLANVLEAMGDPGGALDALERARQLVLSANERPPLGMLVYADLARLQTELGEDASPVLAEGLELYPESPFLLWAGAVHRLRSGQPEAALRLLDLLLAADLDALDDTISYDEGSLRAMIDHARGVALFQLGRYSEAGPAFARAEQLDPTSGEIHVKRVLTERMARMSS